MKVSGTIVDLLNEEMFPGELVIEGSTIVEVRRTETASEHLILPGFVDAHVHIESSMLPPSEFARLAVVHGTVGTVSDPHEIANVLGVRGVHWMLENAREVPFKFAFGAPSCVPATAFETAGGAVDSSDIVRLLQMPEIRYLAEMMNFPGVLNEDPEVMAKLEAAKRLGKPIDGHAPGLRGIEAERYAAYGISTDHECFTAEEALDKLRAGMSIIVREGSAAKNFDALVDLIASHPDRIMLCSDDKHPNDLIVGHIDQLVRRALRRGLRPWDVLRAATVNPVRHYQLPVGLLQSGDPADFIVADNLEDLTILETYIDGRRVALDGQSLIERVPVREENAFRCEPLSASALRIEARGPRVRAIRILPGQLVTKEELVSVEARSGFVESSPRQDLLKLVVLNRYRPAPPALGFCTGFGLASGALASTVAHDCHNIVAVGASDEAIASAVNALIESRGGIAVATGGRTEVLPLSIAGLMSSDEGCLVARRYEELDALAKELGSSLPAPFMSLSFLALLVIPELKLSDLGLFDGKSFRFTSLFAES